MIEQLIVILSETYIMGKVPLIDGKVNMKVLMTLRTGSIGTIDGDENAGFDVEEYMYHGVNLTQKKSKYWDDERFINEKLL